MAQKQFSLVQDTFNAIPELWWYSALDDLRQSEGQGCWIEVKPQAPTVETFTASGLIPVTKKRLWWGDAGERISLTTSLHLLLCMTETTQWHRQQVLRRIKALLKDAFPFMSRWTWAPLRLKQIWRKRYECSSGWGFKRERKKIKILTRELFPLVNKIELVSFSHHKNHYFIYFYFYICVYDDLTFCKMEISSKKKSKKKFRSMTMLSMTTKGSSLVGVVFQPWQKCNNFLSFFFQTSCTKEVVC